MPKRVLLLGGTRFFGRSLLSEMLARGWDVTVLTRGCRPMPVHFSLTAMICDRKDERAVRAVLGQQTFDAIIDNICYDPEDARAAIRLFGDRCERFLFSSTVMTYLNRCLAGHVLREKDWHSTYSVEGMTSQYSPSELEYAQAKRTCEAIFFSEPRLPTIIFRLQNVVGPDDFSGKSAKIPQQLLHEHQLCLLGTPHDTYQQVYAPDIGRLYCEAIEKPFSTLAPVYNVACPPIMIGDYVELLAGALGIDAHMDFRDVGGQNVLSPFPRNIRLDCSQLRKDFHTLVTPYEVFLPDIAHWYKDKEHNFYR